MSPGLALAATIWESPARLSGRELGRLTFASAGMSAITSRIKIAAAGSQPSHASPARLSDGTAAATSLASHVSPHATRMARAGRQYSTYLPS